MDMRPARRTTRRLKPQTDMFTKRDLEGSVGPRGPVFPPVPPDQRAFESQTFAVVSLETTGIGPSDRVVEVAVVRFHGDGTTADEWSTLTNPGRDLGTSRIAGAMEFGDLRHAPAFRDVAGDLVQRLQGTVLAAHNLAFEQRFLSYEFRHLEHALPKQPALSTVRLGCLLGARSRRLDETCRQFDVPLKGLRTAKDDARSTAHLLARYLLALRAAGRGSLEALGVTAPHPDQDAWPCLAAGGMSVERQDLAGEGHRSTELAFVRRLVQELPATDSEEESQYLALLDQVLSDFQVSSVEAQALLAYAQEAGLTMEHVGRLHLGYFEALVSEAWRDHILTADEARQIMIVGALLGATPEQLALAIRPPIARSGTQGAIE